MIFSPPMTMMDFFRKSEGVWFIQRTVHHFDMIPDESGESKIHVQVVNQSDPRIKSICEPQGIDSAIAAGGASFMWQAHEENGKEPDPDKAAVLVDVPDDETGHSGKLLRNQGYVERIPVVSRYWFGQDGILTIDTEYDHTQGQERCWFITDDFRVRASTVRMMNGIFLMTYCSERRCVSDTNLTNLLEQNLVRASASTI
jgi:CpeS-like protein